MKSQTEASAPPLAQWEADYQKLRQSLGELGWISQGYVQDRGPGAGGPCYQWTRKVRGKTVSVALSREQFEWLRQAIENWRKAQETIKEMQRLSRQVLFATVPHPPRRKRLSKKVLVSLFQTTNMFSTINQAAKAGSMMRSVSCNPAMTRLSPRAVG